MSSSPPRRTMRPERLLREASSGFVAITLFLSWLLNLLPWGRWPGVPDFFALCLMYWSLQTPMRLGMTIGLIGGVLLDAHHATLLGEHAVAYTLMVYWVSVLRSRLVRFSPWEQIFHIFPVMLLASGIAIGARWLLIGTAPGWWWVADTVVAALLWPVACWLLQMPQRLADGGEPG